MTDLATELNDIAWEFAGEGRYRLALDVYDRAKSRGFKLSPLDASNCGLFLLCLEKNEEALAQFADAAEREGAYLVAVGVAQWLMGRRRDAVITWRRSVSGVRGGTIVCTDPAGSALNGLLLWYAAVTLKDDDLLNTSMEFLHEQSAHGSPSTWLNRSFCPEPPAYLTPEERFDEAFLQQHFGDKNLENLLRGSDDILRQRELVIALFFLAVNHRADGQEQECRKLMSAVVQIENPLIALEWYLARGELSQSSCGGSATGRSIGRGSAALFQRISSLFKKIAS